MDHCSSRQKDESGQLSDVYVKGTEGCKTWYIPEWPFMNRLSDTQDPFVQEYGTFQSTQRILYAPSKRLGASNILHTKFY